MPQQQQQQVPNVITSRQPFTSIAFQRMPGGFVQPLIGYESNYPHVIDVSPRDYAAPFLAMAFNPMAYIPQGAPQQTVQQPVRQPQQARPSGGAGTGQKKSGAAGGQQNVPPQGQWPSNADPFVGPPNVPPTAMSGQEMFDAALAPYIKQPTVYPFPRNLVSDGATEAIRAMAAMNPFVSDLAEDVAAPTVRYAPTVPTPPTVPIAQTTPETSAAQLRGLLQPTPAQQLVTEALLDEALRSATPPLPAPAVPVQPVPTITIPPLDTPVVTSGMATLRRMLGFQ